MTKKVIETVNGWYMENPKQKVELDDIVGLVKIDEPTDSVQLQKEAQLSICEKRIIELENENEQLKQQLKSIEDSFYNQLLLLSKYWGLGDSISVETVHEEFTPEYIFTIQIPKNLSKKEKNDIFMKLNFQMEHYCKSNNMFNFFKDAYIIFE